MCFKTLKFFIKKPKREHFHSFKEFIISNLFSTKTKISLKSFASHLRLSQWALPCPFATENLKKFPFVLGKKKLESWDVGGIFELLFQINVQFHKYRVSQKFVLLLYKFVFQYDWTW